MMDGFDVKNVVMEEAYNQRMLKEMPTPLAASDGQVHETRLFAGTGYAGVTPVTGAMSSILSIDDNA